MASFKSSLKGIWKGVRPALEIASMFSPHARIIDAAVDAVELARSNAPGREKHDDVRAMALAAVGTLPLTDEQREQLNEAIDAAIKATVAQRNAVRDLKDAYQQLDDVVDSFRPADDV